MVLVVWMMTTPNVKWSSMESMRKSSQEIYDYGFYQKIYINSHQLEDIKSYMKCWINIESSKRTLMSKVVKEMNYEIFPSHVSEWSVYCKIIGVSPKILRQLGSHDHVIGMQALLAKEEKMDGKSCQRR